MKRSTYSSLVYPSLLFIVLLLASCTQPSFVPSDSAVDSANSVVTDADLDHAVLDVSWTADAVVGTDVGTVRDGSEVSGVADTTLSSQAVLSGATGYVVYVRHDPRSGTPWQVWRSSQATDARTQIYAGSREVQSAAVSADGRTVLFAARLTASSGNFEVYRLTIGSSAARLTSTNATELNVSSSADGSTLAWEGTSSGRRAVFVRVYKNGGSSTRILSASSPQVEPTVTADGTYVALVRQLSTTDQVVRYSIGGNTYLAVTSASVSTARLRHPSASSGGSKVAWLETRSGGHIVKVKALSSGNTTVAVSASKVEHPHLTADGAYLTYGLLQSGSWRAFTKNLASGQVATTVTASQPVNVYAPFWQQATAPDFGVSCSPGTLTLARATTTTITCTLTSRGGYTSPASFAFSGFASGVSAQAFAPSATIPKNATVHMSVAVNAGGQTALGKTAFSVNVTSGGKVRTARIDLSVVATSPRVRVIYLVPSDKSVNAAALKGMERAIRHLQIWYYGELGTGKSVTVSYPAVEVVRTPHTSDWYSNHDSGGDYGGWFWSNELDAGFALTGGEYYDQQNIWLYYIDAEIAEGQVSGGNASVAVLPAWDVRGVADQGVEGVCRWVGGLGHELGHALNLPHPPGCGEEGSSCPTKALMWLGYISYPDAFLTGDDKADLVTSPFLASRPVTARPFECGRIDSASSSVWEASSTSLNANSLPSAYGSPDIVLAPSH